MLQGNIYPCTDNKDDNFQYHLPFAGTKTLILFHGDIKQSKAQHTILSP